MLPSAIKQHKGTLRCVVQDISDQHTYAKNRQALLMCPISLAVICVVVIAHQQAVFNVATVADKCVAPNHRALNVRPLRHRQGQIHIQHPAVTALL